MNAAAAEVSSRDKARIAGALYLIIILGGAFAEAFVRGRLVIDGDAAATARNILAHEQLYRWGFVAELIIVICNLPLALIFYDLFKVVNRSAAILVSLFILLGSAVESVSLLAHLAPLTILKGGGTLNAFTPQQLQGVAYTSLDLFESGFAIALVFFGCHCLITGYLIFRSALLPRIIGAILAIEGVCYLLNSFASFLAPSVVARIFPYTAPSVLGEISLCLWLLIMGINLDRWQAHANMLVAEAS